MTRLLDEVDADIEIEIHPIPDLNNNDARCQYIETNLPPFDTIYTGNPRVQDIFAKRGKNVRDLTLEQNIKGTFLRNQIAMQRYGLLAKSTSPAIIDYIQQIHGHERLQFAYEQEMVSPKIAADLILEDQHHNIVLIWRKNTPHGLALPGGFVNYGEEPGKAAIRE
ncbi:MAG: NUDIX domain-containing protein [Candidatus Peribacteria bacterium]|nr:MAG: NUDIX domain-containing protein [Candidatus Peribacteria bacterium]